MIHVNTTTDADRLWRCAAASEHRVSTRGYEYRSPAKDDSQLSTLVGEACGRLSLSLSRSRGLEEYNAATVEYEHQGSEREAAEHVPSARVPAGLHRDPPHPASRPALLARRQRARPSAQVSHEHLRGVVVRPSYAECTPTSGRGVRSCAASSEHRVNTRATNTANTAEYETMPRSPCPLER